MNGQTLTEMQHNRMTKRLVSSFLGAITYIAPIAPSKLEVS